MADEQEAIAPVELETAIAPEAVTETATETIVDEPEIIPDTEEVDGTEGEPTTGEVEEETIEVDWDDGKKYKIPKALEGGILKNKDYTTKTQEAAALRKTLDAEKAQIEERLKATEEELDARADLRQVTKTLDEFSKLTPEDWAAHDAANPQATAAAWRNFQLLKDQKAELEGKISKAQADRTGVADSDLKTRIQKTVEHAQKAIPGWKPDTIPKLVEFATEMGVPEDTIKQVWSPTFIDILHRAHLGHQLLQKQATAPKLPSAQPGKPLAKVNGNSTPAARGDLATDDMAAYVAARKSGVGGKSPLR
jgi:hypothetical protein